MKYYINNFIFFSILGFLIETIGYKIFHMHQISGFLLLWWTPIYGIGVLLSSIIYNIFKKHTTNNILKYFLLFIIYFIIFTIIEYIGGLLIENTLGYSFWDYSNYKFKFNKYTSFETSTLWGVLSIIYLIYIKKFTDKIICKIPSFITYALSSLFIIDFIYSLIHIIKIYN